MPQNKLKLFIHIGSDKCGSTAIQNSLYVNKEALRKHGIYVPNSGLGNDNGHALCFDNGPTSAYYELIEELKSVQEEYKSAIISWEGLHFIPEEQLLSQYQVLNDFDSVAIYYVRDQAEIIQTGILQQWKTSNCQIPFEKILPENRKYVHTADRWSHFLGQKTIVALFDRRAFRGKDLIMDFYHRIGLNETSHLKNSKSKLNISLSVESGFLLSSLENQFSMEEKKREQFVKILLKVQGKFRNTRYFLTKQDVRDVRMHYKKSNELLEEKYHVKILTDTSCWRKLRHPLKVNGDLFVKAIETLEYQNSMELDLQYVSGWHNKEEWGTWAMGEQSEIRIKVPEKILKKRSSIQFKITGRYFKLIANCTDLNINDLQTYKSVDLSNYIFVLSAKEIAKDRTVKLTLNHPTSAIPKAHQLGADIRSLSYGIEGIKCSPVKG